MKKIVMTFLGFLLSLLLFANGNDKLKKHTGETLEVKVLKVNEFSVTYIFPGEGAEQVISRYAIEKIEYSSGRIENVSEKVVVRGEDDWENVVLLEDKAAISGLKKVDEIRGKTSAMGFHTSGTADKKSLKKLKMAAAAMGAQFILLTSDKDNFWTSQSIKKGFAYAYN